MDIMHLLDRLESALTGGARIPLSGKIFVDEHDCLDIVDQLRVAIPDEVKQSRRVYVERDRILQEAEEQAARIVAHAQDQAAAMAQQHEIAKAAEARARRMLDEAEAEVGDRREGADRYAIETLSSLEQRLTELQAVVRNGIQSLSHKDPDGAREPE